MASGDTLVGVIVQLAASFFVQPGLVNNPVTISA
jgi:hypothetical protein